MAARDFVEWCQDMTVDDVKTLDAELRAAGAPTLTSMRDSGYREALAVLARGTIRRESEWLLLNGLLSDMAGALTFDERPEIERLVAEYESRRRS